MHDNFGVKDMKKNFPRLLKLPNEHSLFLFGARNTGKSTSIKEMYADFSTWQTHLN
jgi:predicted AAA+ superfamily ATPase